MNSTETWHGRKLVGEGRNRKGFISKDGRWIFKVPKNQAGIAANYDESLSCKFWDGKSELGARRRLFIIDNIPILIIEALEIDWNIVREKFSPLPRWTDFIDCQQVGIARDQTLKAYDWDHQ